MGTFIAGLSYYSTYAFACWFGLVTGIIHHLLVQYPRQAALFTVLFFYLGNNVIYVFTSAVLSETLHLLGLFAELALFNAAYALLYVFLADKRFGPRLL